MAELPEDTAVVLHDAGAANHVLAWIDAGLVPGARVYAEGPAATLWARRPRSPLQPTLESAMHKAKALISGTGWQSNLEHQARVAARSQGIPSLAVLDHWVNYTARFVRDGEWILPDGLLVADEDAEAIAKAAFPGLPVERLPNHYLAAELATIEAIGSAPRPDLVLALMEPVRDPWPTGYGGEFQALDYLVARWADTGFAPGTTLRLRPHPSEPAGKYMPWQARCSHPHVEISYSTSLAEDVAQAAHVVGLNSYALTIALAAGRCVWSILPPGAPPCVLPHAGIRHLRSLPALVS